MTAGTEKHTSDRLFPQTGCKSWMIALACLATVLPAAGVFGQPANPATASQTEPATRPTLPAVPAEADPILADRLFDIAADSLQGKTLSTSKYRQAGAFLEAASRLNPTEPRYHRLRYEALLQAGDIQGAIDALVQYARLDPTDLQAQAKLIELYTQRMETAEDKLKYLRQDLIPAATIPAEVRSHAAVMACRVLLERGERTAAIGLAGEAARLNPLDPEAQQLRFDLSLRDGTPVDRLGGLLAIVRASPLELGAVMSVADELSRAGLDESSPWYDAALGLSVRNGTPPPRELAVNYAARLFMSGQITEATGLIGRVVAADLSDVGAQFVLLSIDRVQGVPAEVDARKNIARIALSNRLAEVAQAAGDTNATTRPIDPASKPLPPDALSIANRVLGKNDPVLTEAFVAAASDLAFFELFFAESPGPAMDMIEGLKKVLPPESPLLARLEGWLYLVRKENAEARQRLGAIEATDPLAALGMLRLEPDTADGREAADKRARALRSNYSHGITGAIIFSDLLPRKTPLLLTAVAEQLKALNEAFPRQMLRLIDSPQSFYYLKAEPLNGSVQFGTPLLVKVTLVNASEVDLSMGPQGAIRNDLFCDIQVRGSKPQAFPATAFDRLAGPLVLRSRQSASRIVRVDQGRLLAYLRKTPYMSIPMTGTMGTNPAIVNGRLTYGAGGYQVELSRVLEQSPLAVVRKEQRDAIFEGLTSAPPAKRVPLMDAAVVYYMALSQSVPPDQQEIPAKLRSLLDALTTDPDPTIRSWGTFWGLLIAKDDARAALSRSASFDPYWLTRMLGLAGLRGGDIESYRRIATQLSADADPTVAKYAKAALEDIEERLADKASTPANPEPPAIPPAPATPTPSPAPASPQP